MCDFLGVGGGGVPCMLVGRFIVLISQNIMYYSNHRRWFVSIFKSDTRVIISCVSRIPCDVIEASPILPLGSVP